MTLDAYIHRQRLTNAAFAASIGVDQSTIARLRAGAQMPSKVVAEAIYKVTGGEVQPNDFYNVGECK